MFYEISCPRCSSRQYTSINFLFSTYVTIFCLHALSVINTGSYYNFLISVIHASTIITYYLIYLIVCSLCWIILFYYTLYVLSNNVFVLFFPLNFLSSLQLQTTFFLIHHSLFKSFHEISFFITVSFLLYFPYSPLPSPL